MICALHDATISNPDFQISGNLANCVDCGSHSHTAASESTIVPTRGFFSGSVITMGIIENDAESAAWLIVSLAKYCVVSTWRNNDWPLKEPWIFFTGTLNSGQRSDQYGLRLALST